MDVSVNREKCMGHGQCELAAPTVFALDEEGIAFLQVAELTLEEQQQAESAALRCPELAIRIEK